MLDSIGKSALKTTLTVAAKPVAGDKAAALNKTHKRVAAQPAENAPESTAAESNLSKGSSRFIIEESGLFFEKYDKQGKAVSRLPVQKTINRHV
jgi:hypothetical protein